MDEVEEGVPSYQCRTSVPSTFGTHPSRLVSGSAAYPTVDRPNYFSSEPIKQCQPLSGSVASANVGYGCHIGNTCCSCKIPHGVGIQHNTMRTAAHGYSVENYVDISGFSNTNVHCSETQPRSREYTFYQGFGTSYSRIPGYIDVSMMQARTSPSERKNEGVIQMEGYKPWTLPHGWNWSGKEQTHMSQIWKPSHPGEIVLNQQDAIPYRPGRKKRVPYTKLQLKELEREYTVNKFITKDKRRKISASTTLTERQVTIWFQNRRVKDKKVLAKSRNFIT
ncbi:homeobox protein Hox-D13a [Polypterus senegalus]